MKRPIIFIGLLLIGCGKEEIAPVPASESISELAQAINGGWRSPCLFLNHADAPLSGVSSVRYSFEFPSPDGDRSNIVQDLYSDGACSSPLATLTVSGAQIITSQPKSRFKLVTKVERISMTPHAEAAVKQVEYGEIEDIAKGREYDLVSRKVNQTTVDTAGLVLAFGAELEDGNLTIFTNSVKKFSQYRHLEDRSSERVDFLNSVRMERVYKTDFKNQ
jgi:hypothetical protein